MRGYKVLALCIVSMMVVMSMSVLGMAGQPPVIYSEIEDGFHEVDVFLVPEYNLSTIPEPLGGGNLLNLPSFSVGDRPVFSKVLEADLYLLGVALGNDDMGFNMSVRARNASLPMPGSAELIVELFSGTSLVAIGRHNFTRASTETVNMVFQSGEDYLFVEGADMRVRFRSDASMDIYPFSVTAATYCYGRMGLLAFSIPSVTHATINSRNETVSVFPVNDWPQRTVNFTGTIYAAFGADDISSVDIAIIDVDENLVNSGEESANVSELEFWYLWDFTDEDTGVYEYNITITDANENEYHVLGWFEIVNKGIILTTPLQEIEGRGHVDAKVPRSGYNNMTLNVRNLGDSQEIISLYIDGGDGYVSIGGEALSTNHVVEDVPAGGHESLWVNVSGSRYGVKADLDDVIDFTISAVIENGEYVTTDLDFSFLVVPLVDFTLSAGVDEIYIYPGETAVFVVEIMNLSPDKGDTFTVEYTAVGVIDVEISKDGHTLGIGGYEEFFVNVTVPRDDFDGSEIQYSVVLNAVSENDNNEERSLSIVTKVTKGVLLELPDSINVDAEERRGIDLRVRNLHDTPSTFILSVSMPQHWETGDVVLESPVTIEARNWTDVPVSIRASMRVPAGSYDISFTARHSENPNVTAEESVRVVVREKLEFYLSLPDGSRYNGMVAGDMSEVIIPLSIKNAGNSMKPVFITAEIELDGKTVVWDIDILNETGRENDDPIYIIQDGEIVVLLRIVIPRDAKLGVYRVNITVEDTAGNALETRGTTTFDLSVEAPTEDMFAIVVVELWLPLLLFLGVIIMGIMVGMKAKKLES